MTEPELTVLFAHLIVLARNRLQVFEHDEDRFAYLELLRESARIQGIVILAWVLMSNHLHLLVQAPSLEACSRLLQRTNGLFARRWNRHRPSSGPVWSARPRIEPVEDESYFVNCQLYIEHNPVKADLADRAEDYVWSSCRFHSFGFEDGLTTRSGWYHELGASPDDRQTAYRRILEAWNRNQLPPPSLGSS